MSDNTNNPNPSPETRKVEINMENAGDLLLIENTIKEFQKEHGISDKKIGEITLIAGELGENILKHSGKGKITCGYHHAPVPYIELTTENAGELPENAGENGNTTKRSLGIGLGIISRVSDVFTHEQDGRILRMRSIKYCGDFPVRSEVAVLTFPVSMGEKSNGDGFLIHKNQSDLFCVFDALGHGEDAFKSASAVKEFIAANLSQTLDALIFGIHEFIRNRHLRGVTFAAIRVDYSLGKIFFSGLGDVSVKIFLSHEDKILYPIPKDGIVGDVRRTLVVQEFPLYKGAVIAMYTDGVSNKLTIPFSARSYNPVSLVGDLMNLYGKAHDDRTILLAKIL